MGKQVNFFLMQTDIVLLEDKLRNIEPLVVIRNRSNTSIPEKLDSLNFVEDGRQWLSFYILRLDDFEYVHMKYVAAQGYWVVDELRSPVIEFDGCFFNGDVLRRGRIYFNEKYYGENGELIEKPELFRGWANKILVKTRRSLMKYGMSYIGEDAKNWSDSSGGVLSKAGSEIIRKAD